MSCLYTTFHTTRFDRHSRVTAKEPAPAQPPQEEKGKLKKGAYKNKAKVSIQSSPPSPQQQQQLQNNRMFSLGAYVEWPKAKVERLLSDPALLLSSLNSEIEEISKLDCMKDFDEWEKSIAEHKSIVESTTPSDKVRATMGRPGKQSHLSELECLDAVSLIHSFFALLALHGPSRPQQCQCC